MNETLEKKIIANFKNIAGLGLTVESSDASVPLVWTPADFAIEIAIRGGASGWVCMVVDKVLARGIAREVLSRALSRDYPLEEIDEELAENTVGEIVNIALGEYFIAEKNASPADISSPIYHDTSGNPTVARDGQVLECVLETGRFRIVFEIN